jgi:uncharacterized protein (DUF58 family)
MRIRPGKNALTTFILLACVSLLTFMHVSISVVLILGAAAVVAGGVIDYISLKKIIPLIEINQVLPRIWGRGLRFEIVISIKNNRSDPVSGEIREVFPAQASEQFWVQEFSIQGGEESAFRSSVVIPKRGLYHIGPVWVRIFGKFQLLELQKETNQKNDIKILPESQMKSEEILKDLYDEIVMLDQSLHSQLKGVGIEFESLSEYREGDDIQRIDWRATAQHMGLMVRRYQIERHRDVMVLIDNGRLMGTVAGSGIKLDYSVDSALMLSKVALQLGDRCGVGVFDNRVLHFMPPRSGMYTQKIIMESVYNLSSDMRETNFNLMFSTLQTRQRKRALIVILSDIIDLETTERYRSAILSLKKRHVVVFAALRTPLLNKLETRESDSYEDLSRKAVGLGLMREREKALMSLSRLGVSVIDVEPNKLTIPLINQYVRIRKQNII